MSWRLAASVVRDRAEVARRRANARNIPSLEEARLRRHLQSADIAALDAWLQRRIAQELEQAAQELDARAQAASEDVTVSTRKPPGG